MKTTQDLSTLPWRLTGWIPYHWRISGFIQSGDLTQAEIGPVPAAVPGSVQGALRAAGIIPDWEHGLNARLCEWVENRHWVYEADIPDDWLAGENTVRLNALGLDDRGWVYLNGTEVAAFKGSFTPHTFWLSPHMKAGANHLAIVFDCPPRWLGNAGYTSEMRDWRPRFNYTWDWTSRLVQVGIWDALALEVSNGVSLGEIQAAASLDEASTGRVALCAEASGGESVHVTLTGPSGALLDTVCTPAALRAGLEFPGLPVEPWWPNGQGPQPLYDLRVELLSPHGVEDAVTRRLGFRDVRWLPCEGAPPDADPWICAVNGRPVFLQGVNWTPIRPNFADVTDEDYRKRLALYRDLGMNVLRVWGGAFLEKQAFYDLCDEYGLMVWQEMPLSSSGIDNWPPDDEQSIAEMAAIARSYTRRRRHHACLILWSGGNELQGTLDGGRQGCGKPCDLSHPMLRRVAEVFAEEDPTRRFVPTSSSGPRFTADEKEFGRGLHWDVHGPWNFEGRVDGWWSKYWAGDDALFRSETGAPGASPLDIIEGFRGECETCPGTAANPLWRRTAWWIDWHHFTAEEGHEPPCLADYIAWSQRRQAEALAVAARACKDRFPRCGGFIVWMGHDSFPCTANTAIVDFLGRPKPAALALAPITAEPRRTS